MKLCTLYNFISSIFDRRNKIGVKGGEGSSPETDLLTIFSRVSENTRRSEKNSMMNGKRSTITCWQR
jgi:hypothetical protein